MIEIVLRIGFSLLVVLGLMWLLARAVRRPLGAGRASGPLAVLNRQQLSRAASVTVVRVADRAMILGVTEQHVSLLGEADLEDFEPHPAQHRDHLRVPDRELPDAHPQPVRGRLDGSLLPTPADGGATKATPLSTWISTLDFLRERTTRR